MPKVFEVGDTKLGWLLGGPEGLPMASCTLSRTENLVELRIPWYGHASPYARWFAGALVRFEDDPDRSKYSYTPPSTLYFTSVDGDITLMECHTRGHRSNLRQGYGSISAGRLVHAHTDSDYRTLNGYRSYVPGISQWLHLRSLSTESNHTKDGRLESLDLKLKSPDSILIDEELGLSLRPSFSFTRSSRSDASEISERILIETLYEEAVAWEEHEALHLAVADLMGIASWSPYTNDDVQVLIRDDDVSGELARPRDRWVSTTIPGAPTHNSGDGRRKFLFSFDDIGTQGVLAWIKLRNSAFGRGLAPVLDLRVPRAMPIETQVLQSGAGLDAIGYHLALESGLSRESANSESYTSRLKRLYCDVRVELPFCLDMWTKLSAKCYNAIKHANRKMPTIDEMIEATRMNQLIVRVWVCERIAVPAEILKANLELDPMINPYEVV